jgi:hypothetical protein
LEWEDGKAIQPTAVATAISSIAGKNSHAVVTRRSVRSQLVPFALAASLLILAGGGLSAYLHERAKATGIRESSSLPVNASVDLFTSGTLRGAGDDATPLQEVSLPASIVHLAVVLPRFSEVGRYDVLVSRDKAGTQVVAMGAGNAAEVAGRVGVEVTLDLRAAKPGSYFLATVRGVDSGTYYYPLRIK